MSVWILILALLVCGALAGYSFGAIRATFAFFGILIGALAAPHFAPIISKILSALKVENQILIFILPPVIAFLVILIIFKSIGNFLAWKVEVYYKYKVSELRQALWRRLNTRLGICMGLLNAATYCLLILIPLYPISYLTTQVSAEDREPIFIRAINKLGKDLAESKCHTLTTTLLSIPPEYYKTSDLLGTLYHNPELFELLGRYPAALNYVEKPEVKEMIGDTSFTNLILQKAPFWEIIRNDRIKQALRNKPFLTDTWRTFGPLLDDLKTYLETGVSPKFKDEPILGIWEIDTAATFAMLRRNLTNITSRELRMIRETFLPVLEKTRFVATPEKIARLEVNFNLQIINQLLIARMPRTTATRTLPLPAPPAEAQNTSFKLQGRWIKTDTKYTVNLRMEGSEDDLKLIASVEGDILKLADKDNLFTIVLRKL